ncbi:MAG: hypothetical protein ACD_46C00176G0002 [uncultured bacterium]|nr:MAG: hypothetical protein ACD_46C00176G0002 [uncultured bacterium]OGT47579.1 MAG: hypothetical protein A3E83_06770 [Gammaproteobacteria bacterium RIFCSPHIGHO2_12_FULL_41_20]HLB43537.1 glycosyltransferase [Gammaproteobacteria bacterium]
MRFITPKTETLQEYNYKSYLFNLSYSYLGGALKRILAYLEWFDKHGGSCFALNSRLKGIEKKFPNNHYCFVRQNPTAKVFNYSSRLNQFISDIGKIDFYYSYGIPLPCKVGRVNWLHIGNVLPFVGLGYVSFKRSLELKLLGLLIKKSMRYADIISAESEFSLSLLDRSFKDKFVVSVNGSDEEISTYKNNLFFNNIENIAVAVGTCRYKCIDDVYKIYLHLRQSNPDLRLIITGIKEDVPARVQKDNLVVLCGILPQLDVCNLLKKAKYYITTTIIENSYNAASEGAFLAKESFLSDIGPHRKLLKNVKYNVINNLNTRVPSLHVHREDMNVNNLKSWDQIIKDIIQIQRSHYTCQLTDIV